MKIETAAEYCSRIDFEEGEAWSNDYEELAVKMQEYAEYYHQAKLKLLGIGDVVGQSEQLVCDHPEDRQTWMRNGNASYCDKCGEMIKVN